jgi:general secretion pathway protein N
MFYGVAGCAIYAATLMATIPAAWVSSAVERASGERLLLRDPSGSLWTGSGHLYASRRSERPLDLGALRWKTSWSGILSGGLETDLVVGDAARSMQVRLSPSSTTIRGLDIKLPGRILSALVPALEAFGPEGLLRIRSDDLRLDVGSILGLAEIEWRRIRLARLNGVDLGSHVARLRGSGSKVDIELGTLAGPLKLSGGGTWTREAGLDVSGTAVHDAEQPAALGSFLRGICNEYRNGRCVFRLKL